MIYSYKDNKISFEDNGDIYNCRSFIPQSDLIEDNYGLLFLGSPYFTAESDFYEVNLNRGKDKNRLGWIIPINFLCNTDDDYLSKLNEFLLDYADVAFRKLLTFCIKQNLLNELDFEITDILQDSTIIFIYKQDLLSFSEVDYIIPSLYNNGFYTFDNPLFVNFDDLYCSKLMEREFKEAKENGSLIKVNLKLIHEKYYHMDFLKHLYTDILRNNRNPFFRYISLYQVIEILMSFAFDDIYFSTISNYNQGTYSKNELREKLQDCSKEKELINRIYDNIKQTSAYYNDFTEAVKSLFILMGKDISRLRNFQDYMYALRNAIIHDMRNLLEYSTQMTDIAECYEKIIFMLLQECELDRNDRKELFVIDKEFTAKNNKKRMVRVYNSI
ncbi:hypothetical protein [uncultured Bacteroides sp.]|uniref:hypothetical protein n=1 Tax=uncultured Bacteroides sp. TaxID=162156 RepID=UPI002AAB80DB|nr:hypothetical protein [uncultured Bacteroides sp.]